MLQNKKFLSTLLFAVLLTLLFYKQGLGLNLVIAESVLLIYLFTTRQIAFNSRLNLSILALLALSLAFTVIVHSRFIFIMHFIVLFAFVGSMIYSEAKSVVTQIALSIANVFTAQFNLVQALSQSKVRGRNLGRILWRLKIYLSPIFIIFIFLLIYRNSNPAFDSAYHQVSEFVGHIFQKLIKHIEINALFTFVACTFISAFLLLRAQQEDIINDDKNANDNLMRNRKSKIKISKTIALKYEYKAAVFLIFSLNVILLFLNYLDIQYVWFGFSWDGQYLKDFVHQGTYLLVVSIIIAVGLVLYFFRNNLNFFSQNKTLKILCFLWLIQNAVLVISVAQRNYVYIKYYALAYGRIGVFIFLLLALFGLFTVFVKIQKTKSNFYLLRTNALAAIFVLSFSAFFNWDVIIAKYNFKQADKSFLHLEFLSKLSDKALPYLDYSIDDLEAMEYVQRRLFSLKTYYSTPHEFKLHITKRKKEFINRWESQSWLSWNYADARAYEMLKGKAQ